MVKTSTDVMDVHPLERMEKLDEIRSEKKKSLASKKKETEEFELEKRQEIEELDSRKKKELEEIEKKKKELSDLEKSKAKEIEETEDLIDRSFQDLMRHKRQIIKEEEDQKKPVQDNLEQLTANAPKVIPQNTEYGKFFESLEIPSRLYDIANKGFYENLSNLKDKAMTGQLTPDEEAFVERLRGRFEEFSRPSYLQGRDSGEYVKRSMKVIEEIDVSMAYK